ncbi:Tetraacyldisaccharide 4'-kinase [Tepidimonas alkaliphilus]|uniref:Tetraacyldisaccharide 4'-kinase n=1 Tax=Tepidimonas alkaliphilus TaxID=2588942 RepID=A0A554W8R7_9BURK|nr:tetraacyldisaccharide 4'-kinase [Tepidimonas alkaliphilus]TSE19959.1 Tetraacyldisaccharide 4'-kinase [Tepidimonas alkaliphilus]
MSTGPDWLRVWARRGAAARALWPLQALMSALLALRRAAWRVGLRRPWRAPVPVIVVGNVLAGGTGKTPTLIALVRHLRARGRRPGVVARGHGGAGGSPHLVADDPDPARCGDEPVLVAQATDAPVAVARDRPAAVRALLQRHPDVDVVLSDDGLQHWALAADLALVLFDARDVGNGWLLPAGPLREPWPLRRAPAPDVWVLRTEPPAQPPAFHPYPEFQAQRRLTGHADDGRERRPLADWAAGRRPAPGALAGIARPQAFFDALRAAGVPLAATRALRDHVPAGELLEALREAARAGGPRDWLCTEKDAVKLRGAPLPHGLRVWAVPLALELPPAFTQTLDAWLDARTPRQGGAL